MMAPDPLLCICYWGPSPPLNAWATQKRRSGSEPLVKLCRVDRPRNQAPDLSHRQSVRLTTELSACTGPKIEPKTSRADSRVYWLTPVCLVWLAQNYDIASRTSACVATMLFEEFLLR